MEKEERWPNVSYSGFLITSHRHKGNHLHIQSFSNTYHDQFCNKCIYQNIFAVTKGDTVQEGEDFFFFPCKLQKEECLW